MNKDLCTVGGCRNEGRYCRIHRNESFKPSAPIKKESDSRKEMNKQYKKLAKLFITQHPRCQVKGCSKVSEQIHHKAGRIGDLLIDRDYFMAVCADHHRLITDDSKWAIEQGYSVSRLKEKI